MHTKFLFICSANKQRSKTAEDYFSAEYPDLAFQSCGTNIKICEREGTNPLSEEMLDWADVIFVMENKHAKLIRQYSANQYSKKMVILSIEDKYNYYQKELLELLIRKTEKHLGIKTD